MATGEQRIKHIWVITGPAGCGKSTIGSHLAGALELPYLEGDEVSLRIAYFGGGVSHQHPRPVPYSTERAENACGYPSGRLRPMGMAYKATRSSS